MTNLTTAAITAALALTGNSLPATTTKSIDYEKDLTQQASVTQTIDNEYLQISDNAQSFIDNFVNSLEYVEVNTNDYGISLTSSSWKEEPTWKKNIDSSNVLTGVPNYSGTWGQWLLNNIRPGDIIYQPNSSYNHTVLVEGLCIYYYYGENGLQTGTYIRIIEATTIDLDGNILGRVIRSVFDVDSFYKDCAVYRVNRATTSQISGAIDFAVSQLGKGYGFSYGYDANNWWWYCSKLCAAAYMSQGITFSTAEKHPYEYYPNQLINESCMNLVMSRC